MSTYTRFGTLLTETVAAGKLPEVLFADHGDLRNSLSRVADMAYGKDQLDEKQVLGSVESFSRVISDKFVESKYNEVFHKVSDVFASQLGRSINTLRQTKALVNRMCQVNDRYINSRYAEDIVLSKLTGKDKPMQLPKVAWRIFDLIDERNVRANVNLSIGQDVNKPITHTYMMQAINKLPFANQYNQVTLNKLELDPAHFLVLVDQVQAKLPNIDHSHINGILQNIFALNESGMRSMVYTATQLANGKDVRNINKYLILACEYVQVINQITPEMLNVANSTLDEYRKHAEVFNQYAETILYIGSYYRNEVWHGSVLLPGGMVNTDTYQEYEAKGGTMSDLVRHHNYFYQKDQVPLKGISGKFVLDSMENIKNNLSEITVKQTDEINKKKRTIARDSFIAVATEYLSNNQKKLDSRFAYRKNISRFAASVYDANANLPLETKFYRLLMGSCHINDLVSKIYHRLEDAYTESSEQLGQIAGDDKLKIETKVYADLIAEYLVDSGILVC